MLDEEVGEEIDQSMSTRRYQVRKLETGKTLDRTRDKPITGRIVKVTVKE